MVTLAERQKAAHTAFDPEQKALLRRAVGILKDQFVKLKKKEADLGVDPIDTRRKLRILEGDETHPGVVTILAEPSEGDGVQLDGFYEQNGARGVEGEDPEESSEESSEVYPPPVPTPAAIEAARQFLGRQQGEVGAEHAWDPEAWTEEPDEAVREAIAFVSEHGWGRAQDMAEAEHGTGEGPEAVDDNDQEEDDNPWDEHQMGVSGEGLMKAIPFRGSLVKSGHTFGEIRSFWKDGMLQAIKGIGPGGEARLTEWFEDMEARLIASRDAASEGASEGASDPSGLADEPESGDSGEAAPSGTSEEEDSAPDLDEGLKLFRQGYEVPVGETGVVQLVEGRSGCQLAFQKAGARVPTFWPISRPYLSPRQAVILARRLLEGVYTWEEVKNGLVRHADLVDEDETEAAGEAAGAPREGQLPDPAVADVVVVQVPDGAPERLRISGISVTEPKTAGLVEKLVQGEGGEVVECSREIGRVLLSDLSTTLEPGEWSTALAKIEFHEAAEG